MYTVYSNCCCTIHCASIKSYDCYEKSLNFENKILDRRLHCSAFGVLKRITSDMAIYFAKSYQLFKPGQPCFIIFSLFLQVKIYLWWQIFYLLLEFHKKSHYSLHFLRAWVVVKDRELDLNRKQMLLTLYILTSKSQDFPLYFSWRKTFLTIIKRVFLSFCAWSLCIRKLWLAYQIKKILWHVHDTFNSPYISHT